MEVFKVIKKCDASCDKYCALTGGRAKPPRVVYETLIEDKTKKEIYLRLNSRMVRELKLVAEEEVMFEIQFQLNRLPLAEMHAAVDRINQLDLLFLDTQAIPTIPQPTR